MYSQYHDQIELTSISVASNIFVFFERQRLICELLDIFGLLV